MFFQPKLGLTLGGGGARGGAHLGVYKVLTEIGYQPDVVVGTSIGSLMTAMIGAGWSFEKMHEFMCNTDFSELIALDRTGWGLVSVDLMADRLYAEFGNADIRDFSTRIAFVATDAKLRQRILLNKGPVVRAILASSAVPGLFPPVQWNDYMLVDGGVSDNVPTQATYQSGAERVIAVSLHEEVAEPDSAIRSMGTFNGQLQRVFYWLLDVSKRQGAFDTVIYPMSYSQKLVVDYHLAMFPPDVLIQPEMPGVGLFTMEKMEAAVGMGEAAAREYETAIRRIMRFGAPRKHLSKRWTPLVEADLPA